MGSGPGGKVESMDVGTEGARRRPKIRSRANPQSWGQVGGKAWCLERFPQGTRCGVSREECRVAQAQLSQEAECRWAAGSRACKDSWTWGRAGGEMVEHHGGVSSRSQQREVLNCWFAELKLEGASGLGKTAAREARGRRGRKGESGLVGVMKRKRGRSEVPCQGEGAPS